MAPDDVSLQEYLDVQLVAILAKLDAYQKAHAEVHGLESQLRSIEKIASEQALNLLASDHSKHFSELNNHTARLAAATAEMRELYVLKGENNIVLGRLSEDINNMKLALAEQGGRNRAYAAVIALLISIAFFIADKLF
jgi:hypothetical protein